MKITLTPGRLYAELSAEFRQLRDPECANCILPMPIPVEDPEDGEPTWMLGALPHHCASCSKAIARIVRRYQAKYDLMDPISPPVRMRRPLVSPPASAYRH